jgi:hypothetical protein
MKNNSIRAYPGPKGAARFRPKNRICLRVRLHLFLLRLFGRPCPSPKVDAVRDICETLSPLERETLLRHHADKQALSGKRPTVKPVDETFWKDYAARSRLT